MTYLTIDALAIAWTCDGGGMISDSVKGGSCLTCSDCGGEGLPPNLKYLRSLSGFQELVDNNNDFDSLQGSWDTPSQKSSLVAILCEPSSIVDSTSIGSEKSWYKEPWSMLFCFLTVLSWATIVVWACGRGGTAAPGNPPKLYCMPTPAGVQNTFTSCSTKLCWCKTFK